jgi:hypothetical protein
VAGRSKERLRACFFLLYERLASRRILRACDPRCRELFTMSVPDWRWLNWRTRVFYAFNSMLYRRVLDKLPAFLNCNCGASDCHRKSTSSSRIRNYVFEGFMPRGSRFEMLRGQAVKAWVLRPLKHEGELPPKAGGDHAMNGGTCLRKTPTKQRAPRGCKENVRCNAPPP